MGLKIEQPCEWMDVDHFPAVSKGGGRRKPRAGRAAPRLTEKELEEERQRKADRNRAVFLAWLERKQEKEKVRLTSRKKKKGAAFH